MTLRSRDIVWSHCRFFIFQKCRHQQIMSLFTRLSLFEIYIQLLFNYHLSTVSMAPIIQNLGIFPFSQKLLKSQCIKMAPSSQKWSYKRNFSVLLCIKSYLTMTKFSILYQHVQGFDGDGVPYLILELAWTLCFPADIYWRCYKFNFGPYMEVVNCRIKLAHHKFILDST